MGGNAKDAQENGEATSEAVTPPRTVTVTAASTTLGSIPPSWPDYTPIPRPFSSHSLLAGTEALVWQALGCCCCGVKPPLHAMSKQVAVRRALARCGLDWIATNTTPFRITVGKLYDQAVIAAAAATTAESLLEEKESTSSSSSSCPHENNKRPKYDTTLATTTVQTVTTYIPSNSLLTGPWVGKAATKLPNVQQQSTALWQDLNTFGACLVRQAVSGADAQALQATLEQAAAAAASNNRNKTIKMTQLRETMGNGVAGLPLSRYMDIVPHMTTDPILPDLETMLWELLLAAKRDKDSNNKATTTTTTRHPNRKHIFLQYGVGAENWAHQDNHHRHDPLPVQAVLLTSRPAGVDFDGGEFYVARRRDDNATTLHLERNVVKWENAGDLVVFMAGQEWWHGMMPVLAPGVAAAKNDDTPKNYARQAIGMLQPVL